MALLWENEAVLKYLLENRLRILNWESLIRSFFFCFRKSKHKKGFSHSIAELTAELRLRIKVI